KRVVDIADRHRFQPSADDAVRLGGNPSLNERVVQDVHRNVVVAAGIGVVKDVNHQDAESRTGEVGIVEHVENAVRHAASDDGLVLGVDLHITALEGEAVDHFLKRVKRVRQGEVNDDFLMRAAAAFALRAHGSRKKGL